VEFAFINFVGGLGFAARWTSSINNGQWVHLAAVGTRTEANLYVDGVLVASDSGPALDPTPQPTQLNLGRLTVPDYDAFNGALDEVRIYNRALSDSEIQQLHDYEPPHQSPSLQISQSSGAVIIWWPTNASGFELETCSSFGTNQNWTPLNWPILVLGDQNIVAADASIGQRFFRLRKR
jgi:hypothetical protein